MPTSPHPAEDVTLPLAIESGSLPRDSRPVPIMAAGAALGAFEDVYEEHFEFVWRSVRRLGVPEAALDDAVQDVFVVVHRRGSEFEGRSSVRTWLFGIVVHVARAYRRRRAIENAADPDTLADPGPRGQEAALEAAEAMRLLHEVLDTLDDDKREVLVLIELEEMTAPEAAEVLSLKLNTVYTRLRAARRDFDAEVARRAARDEWRLR